MVFAGLENYLQGLRSSITFGGLRPKTTKGGQMIFRGFEKNHFEGLRPQTTKRGQMVFEGLGQLHGRLEVVNHIWRPEAQNHKRRPNDFSGSWKNHLGGLRAPQNEAKRFFSRLWKNHFECLRPQTTKRGQINDVCRPWKITWEA